LRYPRVHRRAARAHGDEGVPGEADRPLPGLASGRRRASERDRAPEWLDRAPSGVRLLNHSMTAWDELVEGVAPELRDRFRLDRIPFESDGAPFGELLSLAGRTVVVTGGGGDDLGRALCHRLAQQGAAVVVLD